MKNIFYVLFISSMLSFSANAQIDNLSGPRLGAVYISPSPVSSFIRGVMDLDDLGELSADYNDITKGALSSLYGWQWETRFADGYEVTGIVEWIALVEGMEKGKFLPSVSSLVGARLASGLEFAIGPNLSLAGVAMVFGAGYNFKAGDLNIPVNLAFVPGKIRTQEAYDVYEQDNNGDEVSYVVPEFDYNTGSRISLTVGFNLGK